MTIRKQLEAYAAWYEKKWLPRWMDESGFEEDELEDDWRTALHLEPLTKQQLATAEKRLGRLGKGYRAFLLEVGAGTLLSAYDDEPLPFTFFTPREALAERKVIRTWLSKEDAAASAKKGLDITKMVPLMTDDGHGWWALLTSADSDRVVLFDHGYETGRPFGVVKPLEAFFKRWIACAKREEPLNPFDGL